MNATEAEYLDEVPSDVPALLDAARSLVIRTSDDADEAGLLLREIGQRKASVAAWFAPLCEQAHRAWKALTARRAEVLAQFDEPERIVHGALTTYRTAELARQREEEEAARRAALAKAEEARIARAERALDRGDDDQAERILEGRAPEPVVVAAPVVEVGPVAGVAFVEKWRGEFIDLDALIVAAAETPALRPLLAGDQRALDGMARALKGAMRIPGCRAVQEQTVRRR